MAVTNLGRPPSGKVRESAVVAVPMPHARKQELEQEARAAGCRSMAQFIRLKLDWTEPTQHKEAHQA